MFGEVRAERRVNGEYSSDKFVNNSSQIACSYFIFSSLFLTTWHTEKSQRDSDNYKLKMARSQHGRKKPSHLIYYSDRKEWGLYSEYNY